MLKKRTVVAALLCAAVAWGACAAQFTVVAIPDTQVYTSFTVNGKRYPVRGNDILVSQLEYIRDHAESNGGDIVLALHEGDVVEHRHDVKTEWKRAQKAMSLISGVVPYLVVPGNHDCDKWSKKYKGLPTQCVGWKYFIRYFGAQSDMFRDADWYAGYFNDGLDSYCVVNAGGYDILTIGLELEAGDAALEWAQGVIDSHPGVATIILTHEYLSATGQDANNPQNSPFANSRRRMAFDFNSPSDIWNKFIRKNSQIFMVLCGHSFSGARGEGMRIDKNDAGYNVYSLLANYQGRRDLITQSGKKRIKWPSGDGFLRLMEFDTDKRELHVKTYSPYTDLYETDEDSDFVLTLDFDWATRFSNLPTDK